MWLARNVPDLPSRDCVNHVEQIMLQDNSGFADRHEFASWLRSAYALREVTANEILAELALATALNVKRNEKLIDFLRALKKRYTLGVISNGSSKTQRSKLHNSGLHEVFDDDKIYIEGETGVAKPHPSMFMFPVADHNISPGEMLFIGDHPLNDMLGARQAGMKTCWICNGRKLLRGMTKPDLMIETIEDLFHQTEIAV